ncbi:hypothetical protein M427DRAFT_61992 [Gonapodya prolifera JEL478]|uniref:Uncharacterized protein n=1 Tax=Gonapodya prolifera (strain JEL478) TaxID=1344416 RepID=A0A139A125_GONPJ|nr:hypothetical protein M427DRAFT_61992 [Gonapodya prolifera JEL478]|eukprot:KXS10461.1 hypothetical protein M427DRAFT_61992 [Gonapodya prolifera JEL478]
MWWRVISVITSGTAFMLPTSRPSSNFPSTNPTARQIRSLQSKLALMRLAMRALADRALEAVRELLGSADYSKGGPVTVEEFVVEHVEQTVRGGMVLWKQPVRGISIRMVRDFVRRDVVTGGMLAPRNDEFADLWSDMVDKVLYSKKVDGRFDGGTIVDPFAVMTIHYGHSDQILTTTLPPHHSPTCTLRRDLLPFLPSVIIIVATLVADWTLVRGELW